LMNDKVTREIQERSLDVWPSGVWQCGAS
jgi:hypothetical protein